MSIAYRTYAGNHIMHSVLTPMCLPRTICTANNLQLACDGKLGRVADALDFALNEPLMLHMKVCLC
jgi:hypothetical protein